VKKPKLLVLLGAGSSVDQGLPQVGELNKEVEKWADEWTRETKQQNFYDLLWRNRANYCSELTKEARKVMEWRTVPNYERILGDLHLLINAAPEKPSGDPMLQWLDLAGLGVKHQNMSRRSLLIQLEDQLSMFLDKLAQHFRVKSSEFEAGIQQGHGETAFGAYRQILAELSAEFDLGVYNLNHDTVALSALPNSFVGFDRGSGAFLASEVLCRPEWGFLYHLHGSAHHCFEEVSHIKQDRDFGPKIIWRDDLHAPKWKDVAYLEPKSDQKRVMLSSLIAGGWKLDQMLSEPFSTLFSCLPRHLHEANAILIAGYGFSDPHIDHHLTNMIRTRANAQGRPRILVLDHDAQRKALAARSDHWNLALDQTLRVSYSTFRSPQHRHVQHWTELHDAVTPDDFEQARDQPVATWNGGFCAAAKKLPQMVKWLKCESDTLQ